MTRLSQPHSTAPLQPGAFRPRPPGRPRQAAVLPLARLGCVLALVCAFALPAAGQGGAGSPGAPAKYAGTYRIAGWEALEGRGLYHFFYLHPNGQFLLAGEWPKNERSRFVGTWNVVGDRMYLNGKGAVDTNQGAWRADYTRTFRIRVNGEGFVLEPEPAKNRFGLMGWPNAFHYYRGRPAPNLPGVDLPDDPDAMARHIAQAMQRLR